MKQNFKKNHEKKKVIKIYTAGSTNLEYGWLNMDISCHFTKEPSQMKVRADMEIIRCFYIMRHSLAYHHLMSTPKDVVFYFATF